MQNSPLNREVKKQAQAVKQCRAQVYLISFAGTVFVLGSAVVMLLGFVLTLFKNNNTLRMVGVGIVAAFAVAIVVFYAVKRLQGPLNYTEFTFAEGGTSFIVQTVGKDKILIQADEKSFSYEKGRVSVGAVLLHTECLWGYAEDSDFSSATDKAAGRMYVGTRKRGERTDKVRIQFQDGKPVFGEVNGIRIRYYESEGIKAGAIPLPPELIDTLKSEGITLQENGILAKAGKQKNGGEKA